MNGERLYEILHHIDDDIVLEADPGRETKTEKTPWKTLIPLAAGLILVIALWRTGLPFGMGSDTVADSAQAPQATADQAGTEAAARTEAAEQREVRIEEDKVEAGEEIEMDSAFLDKLPVAPMLGEGAGTFTLGYRSAEDISVYDFRPALAATDTLPVYRYRWSSADAYHLHPDLPAMQQKAEEIARIFGFDPDEMQSEPEDLPVTDSAEENSFFNYHLSNEEIHITVDKELNFYVFNPENQAMNEDFSKEGQEEQGRQLAALLTDRFGWKQPKVIVTESAVNYNGETFYEMFVYEQDPDPVKDFLQSQRMTASGSFSPDGTLELLRIDTWEGYELVGEYPVLKEEEAKQRLIAGEHLSGPEWDFPGEEYIAQTGLVYKTNRTDIAMPYYEFYVELPDERLLDMKNNTTDEEVYQEEVKVFTTFVVPAIQPDYLEELPAREIQGQ